jgi:hypothetical protein
MYDIGRGIEEVERPSPARRALLSYVRDVTEERVTFDEGEFRRLFLPEFSEMNGR